MAQTDRTFLSIISEDYHEHKRLMSSMSEPLETIRLIDCIDGLLFYWSESRKNLCVFDVDAMTPNNEQHCLSHSKPKTIIPSASPLFDVKTIKISLNGYFVLIHGTNGAAVIEIPRIIVEMRNVENKKDLFHSRSVELDKSFFSHHKETKILVISWYPISQHDKYLVVLTNDNCLRFYDLDFPDQPLLRIQLFNQHYHSVTAGSISGYASVFGDLAVDFDFGKPSIDSQGQASCSIYIMQESGDVWLIKCRFSQNRLQVAQQGPLTMNPPSEDNYGCSYCSLICLQSEPAVLALATTSGSIHHCLVLENDNDDGFRELSSDFEDANTEALYVYETVQLELIPYDENQSENINEEIPKWNNLFLQRDPLDVASYASICKGGIHFVILPWVKDLKSKLHEDLKPDSDFEQFELEVPAELSYLLCTQPSEKSPAAILCGCGIMHKNSVGNPILFCMLSGELITLKPIRNKIIWEDLNEEHRSKSKFHSPIRILRGVGDFANHLNNILTKNATVPRFRTDCSDERVPVDVYYKLLTKTTQIIRQEYIQKMMQAKLEFEKRCKILQIKNVEQIKEMEALTESLQDNTHGETIATKLETAQENAVSLLDRIGALFRSIQQSYHTMSKEETEWLNELKKVEKRSTELRRLVEVVKIKHENLVLQELPEVKDYSHLSVRQKHLQGPGSLTTSQAIKIRAVLKDQEKAISKLVEDVQQLHIRVGT